MSPSRAVVFVCVHTIVKAYSTPLSNRLVGHGATAATPQGEPPSYIPHETIYDIHPAATRNSDLQARLTVQRRGFDEILDLISEFFSSSPHFH